MNSTNIPQSVQSVQAANGATGAHAAPFSQGVVELVDVSKIYGTGGAQVKALDHVSVSFEAGKFTAIMGPSGSGKSTMLHMLAGLDTPSAGKVLIEGKEITRLKDDALTKLRRDRIGFVFQSFNLVPTLDAAANIKLPAQLAGRKVDERQFAKITNALGIEGRLDHRPSQLSGGQQQRVAMARALVMNPAVIVADEPTGNLDSVASREVLSMLRQAVTDMGQTVIMVTHDSECASVADRVLEVRDGKISADHTLSGGVR